MVDIIFEAIEQYGIAFFLGALGVFFFIYPFIENRMTFNIKDFALYWAIGAFFVVLAVAILLQNGVVVMVLLISLFAFFFLLGGVSEMIEVSKYNDYEVEGILTKIKERRLRIEDRSESKVAYYKLTLLVPETRKKYTVNSSLPKEELIIGKKYKINIPEKGYRASFLRKPNFVSGMFMALLGVGCVAMLLKILNII